MQDGIASSVPRLDQEVNRLSLLTIAAIRGQAEYLLELTVSARLGAHFVSGTPIG